MTPHTSRARAAQQWAGILALAVIPAAGACARQPSWSVSGSAGVVSDYVARGLSLSWGQPALQADIEVEHDSGFYIGASGSSVSRRLYPGARLETALWLGFEREWGQDATWAAELLYDAYPGANADQGRCAARCPSQTFDTTQVRLVGTWQWLTLRHGVALGNYYGASVATGYSSNTRGTTYTELNAEPDLPWDTGWKLSAHVGATRYTARFVSAAGQSSSPSYQDVRLGISKSFTEAGGTWKLSLAWTRASNGAFYGKTTSAIDGNTTSLGKSRVVFGLSREFD
jgi:uncharacterized protein (TIGR02001 family)